MTKTFRVILSHPDHLARAALAVGVLLCLLAGLAPLRATAARVRVLPQPVYALSADTSAVHGDTRPLAASMSTAVPTQALPTAQPEPTAAAPEPTMAPEAAPMAETAPTAQPDVAIWLPTVAPPAGAAPAPEVLPAGVPEGAQLVQGIDGPYYEAATGAHYYAENGSVAEVVFPGYSEVNGSNWEAAANAAPAPTAAPAAAPVVAHDAPCPGRARAGRCGR